MNTSMEYTNTLENSENSTGKTTIQNLTDNLATALEYKKLNNGTRWAQAILPTLNSTEEGFIENVTHNVTTALKYIENMDLLTTGTSQNVEFLTTQEYRIIKPEEAQSNHAEIARLLYIIIAGMVGLTIVLALLNVIISQHAQAEARKQRFGYSVQEMGGAHSGTGKERGRFSGLFVFGVRGQE